MEKIPKDINAKLFKVKYNTDEICHLKVIDETKCLQCIDKPCTIVCPANVYNYNEAEKKLTISYEKCLECGACRLICKNIDWKYPRGGKGVIFKSS